MKVTAETITDEQIRELRRMVVGDSTTTSRAADEFCHLAWMALDDGKLRHNIIREARARCAAVWNARHADKTRQAADLAEQRIIAALRNLSADVKSDPEWQAKVLAAIEGGGK